MDKFCDNISQTLETPWKALTEVCMYLIKPFVILYLSVSGVLIEKRGKYYGFPKIFRHLGSEIIIGKNFENRNWRFSNPLGINHPTIFCTWNKDSEIKIGSDVGISGGSIISSKKIEIGDGTIIGANCTIIDSDFHPIKSLKRRYDKKNIKTKEVYIGKNVFIGMNSIILKGVVITDNTVVPAGSVVRAKQVKK